jgi:tetratricopeptide (TPR) repeat protein
LVSRATAAAAVLALVLVSPIRARAQVTSAEAVKLANAGAQAIDERRFADALASFTAAAKLAPGSADIAFGVGLSAYMLGQNAEAERQFQRTLKSIPRSRMRPCFSERFSTEAGGFRRPSPRMKRR